MSTRDEERLLRPAEAPARRLAAILFTDIVGYTALMEADEARAIAVRDRHRALLRPIVEQFHGELIEAPGDEALAVFASSLHAVDCALALQAALRDADDLRLRIGIHVGDVLFRDGEVVGEGVNVAARIRSLAEPGGICVSGPVYQHVKNHPRLHGRSLGSRSLKNVAQPIEVFALSAPGGEPPRVRPRRARLGLAAGAALVLAAGLLWRVSHPLPPAPAGHSLAVLPFVNLSADPDQEYFADGIAEELLNTVAHFEGLRVVGRTSSFSFRDSDADLRAIGQALHADVILEGSVRSEGDRVRITAQLVDAENGYHLWSETYDRELDDIFAIQTEIATEIASALRVELSSDERQRLATPPTQNLDAYQAYLLGRQGIDRGTSAAREEAIRYCERAIELDPTFALAHAALAEAYIHQFAYGDLPPDEMLARAQAAADRALDLDDQLAEAHAALAEVKWSKNDFEGAEAEFQRALALNPNSAAAHRLYGNFLWSERARYEEALALSTKAVELDPLSLEANLQLAEALHALGRFDESLARDKRLLEIDADYPDAYRCIGDHHATVLGRVDEAVVWYAKALALDPGNPFLRSLLGWLFIDLGDPDRADYWIQRSVDVAPDNFYANLVMQDLALYRGDDAIALEFGRKAFAILPLEWGGGPLARLRDHEVRAGHYVEARALYQEHFPELLGEGDPEVDLRNYRAAIGLALILFRTGERERGDRLLDLSLEQIAKRPRLGSFGYGIADVRLYALRGERQKALSALRQAIDEGWRANWWYQLQHNPDLEPLHGDPEYQAMVDEIRADMAAQLERVREMERRGELVLAAEPPAPSDRRSDQSD